MPEWLVWTIVGMIGLAVALIVHAMLRQARGSELIGTLLLGIAGAFLGAWMLPRIVETAGLSLAEARFLWAVVGGLVLSLIYELALTGTHQSRILIPTQGR